MKYYTKSCLLIHFQLFQNKLQPQNMKTFIYSKIPIAYKHISIHIFRYFKKSKYTTNHLLAKSPLQINLDLTPNVMSYTSSGYPSTQLLKFFEFCIVSSFPIFLCTPVADWLTQCLLHQAKHEDQLFHVLPSQQNDLTIIFHEY